MTDRPWKRTEREVAVLLGGQRVPVTGRARGSTPDVAHPTLSIEVKHRRQLPEWIRDAMRQARASADAQQVPIVVLHQQGDRHERAWVVLEMSDFRVWMRDKDRGST